MSNVVELKPAPAPRECLEQIKDDATLMRLVLTGVSNEANRAYMDRILKNVAAIEKALSQDPDAA